MTDRFIGPSGGKRRQRFWMLSSLVAVLALAFAVNGFAGPVGQAGGFEDDDGNLIAKAPINFDWNSFDPTTWSPHRRRRRRGTDDKTVSGLQFKGLEDYRNPGASSGTTADSAFAGGTKQDNNCATVNTGEGRRTRTTWSGSTWPARRRQR